MSLRFAPLSDGPGFAVMRPVLLIGRHPDCDVRLDLPQISRRHCCLALASDRLLIRDLGSRNGVRVNGRSISEMVLQPGDEIAIAQVIFRLIDADPAPATPTPTPASVPIPADADADAGSGLIELVPLDD
jgi:pSer/pThr/pTyr-binding forkhead associated (FHA) protein